MKTRKFFHMIIKNQTVQACVLWIKDSRVYRNMKIARDDSAVKLGCSEWCGLPLNALERASDVIFWGLLTMMSCPRWTSAWSRSFWAVRVGPQHDRGRSETVMMSMNFNSYASLAIFFIIPVLFCFVFEHETMYTQAWPISDFYSRYRYTIKLKGDEDTGIPD